MSSSTNPTVRDVTDRIRERSQGLRGAYLTRLAEIRARDRGSDRMGCANVAHAVAGIPANDKFRVVTERAPNIGIVTAYNDMLSAHAPYQGYPDIIKQEARRLGATAQVAGGVPAMCDGVTQGTPGMELSLFSRDLIAMSTAVALTHDMFDAALLLGVCDKIVPGLLIGALSFGHLPTLFVPAGPMTSGLSNALKSKVRQQYATGEIGRDELLAAESAAYHGPGTCTFYGTANSNQMLMELMGLHLPGASFVNPGTPLRTALTEAAAARAVELRTPVADIVDEHAVVNGVVALLATGGSTNHTMHLVAMARAAGIDLRWDDFADLSAVVPLLARIYPNGKADINHFHAAGGTAFLVRELVGAGLMHPDVQTVAGPGLGAYTTEPMLVDGRLTWRDGPTESLDLDVLRPVDDPFDKDGGLRMLAGNLGRAVIKTSAVVPEQRLVEAPARVFGDQSEFQAAFEAGELTDDLVAVVRYQGP